jgi:hypothetical protein
MMDEAAAIVALRHAVVGRDRPRPQRRLQGAHLQGEAAEVGSAVERRPTSMRVTLEMAEDLRMGQRRFAPRRSSSSSMGEDGKPYPVPLP